MFETGCKTLLICLLLQGLFVLPAHAQAADQILPPSKTGLLPVHLPDLAGLTGLEPGVQEHLRSLPQDAAAWLKEAANDAQRSEAYGLLGRVYQAYGLLPPAEECYLNAQRLAPQESRWVYLLGSLCQAAGRTDEAIRHYQTAQRLRPDYLATPVHLGDLYWQQNRLDEARAAYQQALALNHQCTAAHYGLGQVALSQRKYAEAAAQFERALAQAPEANRIHYALALAYRGLGELDKARAALERQGPVGVRVADPWLDALQELVRGERLHLVRGRMAFDARRFADAAAEYRKAVAANPNSLPARINLGSALAQLGEQNAAIEQFQAALRLEAEHAVAHYNLGVLFAKQQQPTQSVTHLRAALKQQPQDTEARFLLAQQLLKMTRPDEALAEFAQVVANQPDNEEALLEWVKLLVQNKQEKQALEQLEQNHTRYPQRGRTAALLAYLLAASAALELRDGARALELSKRVFATTGTANHGALVALALAELGRCAEAAEWQRRMIEAAKGAGNPRLAAKLQTDLAQFEQVATCRPASGANLER